MPSHFSRSTRIFTHTLFFLFVTLSQSTAQSDSLKQILNLLPKEGQITRLKELAKMNRQTNPAQSLEYQRQALRITLTTKNDSILNRSYISMSIGHRNIGKYDSAQHYLDLSYELSNKLKDSLALGIYFETQGTLTRIKGNPEKATEYLLTALRLYESQNYTTGQVKVYNGLGRIYNGGINADYPKALKYFKKGIALLETSTDTAAKTILYTNAAYAYSQLEKFDSAMHYLNYNISWERRHGKVMELASDMRVLGQITRKKGDFEGALDIYLEVLELHIELNNLPELINVHYELCYMYLKMELPEKALIHAQEAFTLLETVDSKSQLLLCHRYFSLAYKMMGEFDQAYLHLEKFYNLRMDNMDEKKANQIIEMETKYETEKKDIEIQLLKTEQKLSAERWERKQIQQLGLGGIILLLVAFFVYFSYNYRAKNKLKQQLLESEIQELRGKITGLLENKPDALDLSFESLNNKLNVPLSEREFDVLMLILGGLGNKEIAERLFVTIHTVKFHLSNIYDKLGVSNRKEALKFVISVS